jgi:tRNA pseudouridine13 synthase
MTAWVAGLRRLGAKAATRPLFVMPGALEWQLLPASTQLSFRLPAGSYATALLREVFIVEDAAR